MKTFVSIAALWMGILLIVGCNPKSQYDLIKEQELASGIKQDSLFLGLSFGMSAKEFYTLCWELNKQGLIRQGPRNESVQYTLKDIDAPTTLNFYPTFVDDKIVSMPCVITHDNWAPWNKALFGDSLALKLKDMYMDWYGGQEFIEINSEKGLTAYIKIDGNRQITMIARDELVKVLFKDLSVRETENNAGSQDLSP